jgi:hypothetical protein
MLEQAVEAGDVAAVEALVRGGTRGTIEAPFGAGSALFFTHIKPPTAVPNLPPYCAPT